MGRRNTTCHDRKGTHENERLKSVVKYFHIHFRCANWQRFNSEAFSPFLSSTETLFRVHFRMYTLQIKFCRLPLSFLLEFCCGIAASTTASVTRTTPKQYIKLLFIVRYFSFFACTRKLHQKRPRQIT
jgi:hypothetical protein